GQLPEPSQSGGGLPLASRGQPARHLRKKTGTGNPRLRLGDPDARHGLRDRRILEHSLIDELVQPRIAESCPPLLGNRPAPGRSREKSRRQILGRDRELVLGSRTGAKRENNAGSGKPQGTGAATAR